MNLTSEDLWLSVPVSGESKKRPDGQGQTESCTGCGKHAGEARDPRRQPKVLVGSQHHLWHSALRLSASRLFLQ